MNFYRSFYDAAGTLPEAGRRKVLAAMLDYFFTGEAPARLSAREAAIFNVCAGRIAKSRQNAANVGARYATAKAVPKATKRATDAGTKLPTEGATLPPPEGEGEIKRKTKGAGACAGGRALGPSLAETVPPQAHPDKAEVAAWFEANGRGMSRAALVSEAGKFYDHFEAQGWVTGAGVPISRWQSKASAWLRRCEEGGTRGRAGDAGRPRRAAVDLSAYSAPASEVVRRG